jgi:hypothetical protein
MILLLLFFIGSVHSLDSLDSVEINESEHPTFIIEIDFVLKLMIYMVLLGVCICCIWDLGSAPLSSETQTDRDDPLFDSCCISSVEILIGITLIPVFTYLLIVWV